MFQLRMIIALILTLSLGLSNTLLACPFCSAVSQTFSEEMKMMDVVTLTTLKKVGRVKDINTSDAQAEVPKSTFEITKVIKGEEYVKVGDTFDTIYFGEAKKDRAFLAMATDPPSLIWSTPLILKERSEEYLTKLKGLPEGGERLEFFQDYLEDEDDMLARDAYDEFAKAPYDQVIALKPKMDREKLISFIKNPDVPSNRRRLYFTMLGVCGTKDDAKLLEKFMAADDRKSKAGLDAMLACYVTLTGEKGLDKVDELFLKNRDAEYADTYAAIMAIRFHGSETDIVPRTRLVKSLRHMLDRPELADLVIPDLARWEDWEVLTKLTDLFIRADENSSWVRVPVINYLRACPLPLAKTKIEELKLVDADSVKRAMTFFPLTTGDKSKENSSESSSETDSGTDSGTDEKTGSPQTDTTEATPAAAKGTTQKVGKIITESQQPQKELAETDIAAVPGASNLTVPVGGEEVAQAWQDEKPLTIRDPKKAREMQFASQTSINPPDTMQQIESQSSDDVNTSTLLGVTLVGGGLCFVAMRSILGVGIRA